MMTTDSFLQMVQSNPVLVYYYAFSILMSVSIGLVFVRSMGNGKVWNLFFGIIIHIVSFIGMFSLIGTLAELVRGRKTMNLFEMLIPFFVLLLIVLMLKRRLNLGRITRFRNLVVYFLVIASLLFLLIGVNYSGIIRIQDWPVLWVIFLLGCLMAGAGKWLGRNPRIDSEENTLR